MDISFKFYPEVLIGADTLSMAGTVSVRHGSRIMIAAESGLDSQIVKRLKEILEDSGLQAVVFDGIESDSSADACASCAENIAELSLAAHCDAIIGIGGNKAQTIARMAAIMTPMRMTAFELFDGRSCQNKFLPFISIPTECTSAFSFTEYFIAADPRNRLIKSIQSPGQLYSAVIIDSSLFKPQSGDLTSADAAYIFESLFSAAEAYCSAKSSFLSDTLLEKALNIFSKIIKNPSQPDFADNLAQASFLASFGSAVSSPGVGSALSAAISSRTQAAQSLCSSALFPGVALYLINARPEKMARLAAMLGAPKAASVADTAKSAADAIRGSMETLNVPRSLKQYNIQLDKVTAAAEAARSMGFVSNSPWPVSEEDVFNILKEIL